MLIVFGSTTLIVAGIFAYSIFSGENYDSKYETSEQTMLDQLREQVVEQRDATPENPENPVQGGDGANPELENPNNATTNTTRLNLSTSDSLLEYLSSEQFLRDAIIELMIELEAYNLHEVVLNNDDLPIIEIHIGSIVYGVEIVDGDILVTDGEISGEDIVITTTRDELEDIVFSEDPKAVIVDSFNSGRSNVELVPGRGELVMKGYLQIYNELYGTGITGSVIRIFL